MNGRGAWLRLWYLWAPAGVLVLLNLIWLTGLRVGFLALVVAFAHHPDVFFWLPR